MSTSWCLTWNNYSTDDYKSLSEYESVYKILAKEIGESGTPHIQGYIEFKSTKELSVLHNTFPKVHFEKRRGTQEQAIIYCMKDKDFIETGTKKQQGQRTDLIKVANAIVEKTFESTDFPVEYIKYSNGIKAFKTSLIKDRTEKPHVIWLHGESGTGKTRTPVERFPNSYYIKDNSQWWDGYSGEQCIIIDDFSVKKWDVKDLLQLLDRYKYQGQSKGGYVKINSPFIYITCDNAPSTFWSDNDLKQVVRRIDEITELFLPSEKDKEEVGSKTEEVNGNTNIHTEKSDKIIIKLKAIM
nr:MAG: replication associated protein [Cressdnaviricota sp.]